MTETQRAAWTAWLDLQWNNPSRADAYAMRIAFFIARSNAENPSKISEEDMRIRFVEKKTGDPQTTPQEDEPAPLTAEQVIEINKTLRAQQIGGSSTVIQSVPREQLEKMTFKERIEAGRKAAEERKKSGAKGPERRAPRGPRKR